jgi:hypothetical protein
VSAGLRARFEAWAVLPPHEYDLARVPEDSFKHAWPGKYVSPFTETAWYGWECSFQSLHSTGDDARDACTWSQEDEDSDSWNTSCGHIFRLDEGSPEDNGMKFCCYCGGTVTSERGVDEDAAITGAQGHE